MADANERTFIMIKPDGVQRGIVGDIIRRFEQRGYKLVGLKMMQVRENTISSRRTRVTCVLGTKSFTRKSLRGTQG